MALRLRSADCTDDEKASLQERMGKREELLSPLYHQVAVHFADLHDTPARMVEKGVIRYECSRRKAQLGGKVRNS